MIYEKLIAIQQSLKAPKGQTNTFGGYKYRSCEDILEAVKPHLAAQGVALILSDSVEAVEGRVYVRATAQLMDGEEVLSVSAYAREEETKKGMDTSQITGAASSYARKYALNGLFCIDDTKDSDYTNRGDEEPKKAKDFQPTCADCGKYITDKEHDFSVKRYGRPLCRDCQRNEGSNR